MSKKSTCLALLCVVGLSSVAFAQRGATAVNGAQTAITLFADNRAKFDYYSCRYKVTRARAKSYEDGMAGRWENAVSAGFVLVVDKGKEFSACDYSTEIASIPESA